jgi:hypothetical protein
LRKKRPGVKRRYNQVIVPMKSWHTAVLALIGWCSIMPPIESCLGALLNVSKCRFSSGKSEERTIHYRSASGPWMVMSRREEAICA